MKKDFFVLLSSVWLLLTNIGVAQVIYTEPHGAALQFPAGIATWQFVGIRFQVDQSTELTAVHSEMGGTASSFFAALVALPFVTSFPQGNPLTEDEVLYTTTFNLTSPLAPVDIPFNFTVEPGAYALVFGQGLFGSAGSSGVVARSESVPGSTGMAWQSDSGLPWHDTTGATFNVSIGGVAVPEAASGSLLVAAILAVWASCRHWIASRKAA